MPAWLSLSLIRQKKKRLRELQNIETTALKSPLQTQREEMPPADGKGRFSQPRRGQDPVSKGGPGSSSSDAALGLGDRL